MNDRIKRMTIEIIDITGIWNERKGIWKEREREIKETIKSD